MAANFVQELAANTDNNSGATLAITPLANASAGNSLVLAAYCEDAVPTGVTDTKGNAWALLHDTTLVANFGNITFWGTNQDVGAITTSDTVTLNRGGFNRPVNYSLVELSGVDASVADRPGTTANTANPQTLAATGATAQADEIVLAYIDGHNATALGIDAALTPVGAEVVSATGGLAAHRTRSAYQVLSATGTPSYSIGRTGGARTISALVTIKGASGTINKAASDSAAESESAGHPGAVESAAVSDTAAVDTGSGTNVSVSDSATMSDPQSQVDADTITAEGTLSESAVVTQSDANQSLTDTGTVGDAASVSAQMSRTDAAVVAEAVTPDPAMNLSKPYRTLLRVG